MHRGSNGGPWQLVAWNGVIGILALAAFAAALEGYLFTRMSWLLRVSITVAIVAVFWPDFLVEAIGAAVIVLAIASNWMASRKKRGCEIKAPVNV